MLRDKMLAVMQEVNSEIAEREELIQTIALALLSGRNLFILGAPGQANAAPDNGKAKALVQLRTGFAGLYREWQVLDAGATTNEQHRQAADVLNTLEEMSRKAHEACAFTPVPLAQLAALQSVA